MSDDVLKDKTADWQNMVKEMTNKEKEAKMRKEFGLDGLTAKQQKALAQLISSQMGLSPEENKKAEERMKKPLAQSRKVKKK